MTSKLQSSSSSSILNEIENENNNYFESNVNDHQSKITFNNNSITSNKLNQQHDVIEIDSNIHINNNNQNYNEIITNIDNSTVAINTALCNITDTSQQIHLHQDIIAIQKQHQNLNKDSYEDDNIKKNKQELSRETDYLLSPVNPTYSHQNRPQAEVELISLVDHSSSIFKSIPKYKLRIDTVTDFTGYRNNDWLIHTPLIDLEEPVDLNPAFLRETLKLFLQSSERLTQMTKVYNDVEALTKLLEEKERDVELAARIGQSLLDQNQNQNERIDELERELSSAKEKITQLQHEVSSKSDLLRFYITKDDDNESNDGSCIDDDLNNLSITSQPSSFSKDVSKILEELEERVNNLEEENNRLKIEKELKANDLEEEERKELQLINECAHRLSQTNRQIVLLQEEITKKNDENLVLNKEVQKLKNQVNCLEKQLRKLKTEKDDLVNALNLAHECQNDLAVELIDIKDKHTNLLGAFHDKQEECRQLRQQQFNDPIFSYVDSLAYELENSFNLETDTSNDHIHIANHSNINTGNCLTPDSLLSSDSFYTNSPYSSIVVTSTIHPLPEDVHNRPLASTPLVTSSTLSTRNIVTYFDDKSAPSQPSSSSTTCTANSKIKNELPKSLNHRFFFQTDKLRYIKPIEGSQILNHWRRLANPNLNDLFTDKDCYISRIKANLAAKEIQISNECKKQSGQLENNQNDDQNSGSSLKYSPSLSNNFVTTNSVFTFTTTSLSHTKESMTEVTTSFSNVRPSTGKNEFSIDKHLTNLSILSNNNLITSTSLAQFNNRISLVEQVKNIMKMDQLSSSSTSKLPTPKFMRKPMTDFNNESLNTISQMDKSNYCQITSDPNIKGLNELARLFSFDAQKSQRNGLLMNDRSNFRTITKLQMANNGFPKVTGHGGIVNCYEANTRITSLSEMFSKKTDNRVRGFDQQSPSPSSNLSVLRNLRKGGLI